MDDRGESLIWWDCPSSNPLKPTGALPKPQPNRVLHKPKPAHDTFLPRTSALGGSLAPTDAFSCGSKRIGTRFSQRALTSTLKQRQVPIAAHFPIKLKQSSLIVCVHLSNKYSSLINLASGAKCKNVCQGISDYSYSHFVLDRSPRVWQPDSVGMTPRRRPPRCWRTPAA